MPAAKDVKLLKGHWTEEQKLEKENAKSSVTPSTQLSIPDIIKNDANLYAIWTHTIKLYDGTELINALDEGLLARYCIESNKLNWLYEIRTKKMSFDNILKIETRIEAKTKLINSMAISLYMTPRARAGAIPGQPDKEAKEDNLNGDMFD